MVTPSLYVRKGGVRAQGLHSPTSCESTDFPSAHPQLVGLCRVLNPIFHGSVDSCMKYKIQLRPLFRIGNDITAEKAPDNWPGRARAAVIQYWK